MDCHWFFDKTQKKLRRETRSEEKEVEKRMEKRGRKEKMLKRKESWNRKESKGENQRKRNQRMRESEEESKEEKPVWKMVRRKVAIFCPSIFMTAGNELMASNCSGPWYKDWVRRERTQRVEVNDGLSSEVEDENPKSFDSVRRRIART